MIEDVVLNEVHTDVHLGREEDHHDDAWYLDISASNHMSGCRDVFTKLDTSVTGSVKVSDGSIIDICGCGTVLFMCHNG